MKKLDSANEPMLISLDPIKTPKAYHNKVLDLTMAGHSLDEARKLALEPIECEWYYEVGSGLFAIESGAADSGPIYSPYTMEEYLDIS